MTDAPVTTERTLRPATDGPGPLAGVRVVELGMLLAGPFTGRLLGDMGAEIIKVEPPGQPDPLRDWGHARYEGRSLWWPVQSRNKKCVTLNLREERGQELLLGLVEQQRRPGRELPAGHARALEPRARAAVGGEPRPGDRARLRLRADRAVRAARRLRLGLGGDGRHPPHQRLPGRAAAAHPHLARRLARRDVRGAGHSRRPLPARRARRRPRAGGGRLADGGLLRAAGEHGSRVRPARHRPRPRRDRAEGRRPLEHLQVERREVDGDRRERGQGLRAAVRGDGAGRSSRTTRSSPPMSPAASTRRSSRASSPSGRRPRPRPRSTPCSTRRA